MLHTLLPRESQPVVPWRNGSGSTRQVAIEPPAASVATGFRWRVSVATVGCDGPFSVFPGVDRSLWLLRGNGMLLDVAGRPVRVDRPLQRLDLAGETAVGCRLIDGPCEDCSVMVERAAVAFRAEVVAVVDAVSRRLPAGAHVALLLAGTAVMATPSAAALADGDALRLYGAGDVSLRAGRGGATLLLASFHARA